MVDAGGTAQPAATGTAMAVLPGQVRVTWNRVSEDSSDPGEPTGDFLGYRVERRAGGGLWERLTPLPIRETSFLDPAPPTTGQLLEYKVIALDTSGPATSFTTLVSTTLATDLFRPSAPGGVFGSSGPGAQQVSLGWDPSPEPDVLGYKVYKWNPQAGGGAGAWELAATVASGTRATLSIGAESVTLKLRVTAYDAVGESSPTEPVSVRPALSTLTVPVVTVNPWERNPAGSSIHSAISMVGNVYRREEGAEEVYDRVNAGLVGFSSYGSGIGAPEECKSYVVRATQAESEQLDMVYGYILVPTGDESALSAPVLVERHLTATRPIRVAHGAVWNPEDQRYDYYVTLGWDGDYATCGSGDGTDFTLRGAYFFREDAPGSYEQLSTTLLDGGDSETYAAPDNGPHRYRIQLVTNNLEEKDRSDIASKPTGWGLNVRSPFSASICISAASGEVDDQACAFPPGGGGGPGGDPPPDDAPPPRMRKIAECLEARPEDGMRMASFEVPPEGDYARTRSTIDPQVAALPEVPAADRTEATASMRGLGLRLLESDLQVIGTGGAIGCPANRGTRYTFLHADHLGTTRLGTSEVGADGVSVVFRSAAMPYGERLIGKIPNTTTADLTNRPKGFAGHDREEGSSLVYMMARSYSPILGRFVSADPMLRSYGSSSVVSRYAYGATNPLRYADPTGEVVDDQLGITSGISGCVGRLALNYLSSSKSTTWSIKAGWAKDPETGGGHTLAKTGPPYGRITRRMGSGMTEVVGWASIPTTMDMVDIHFQHHDVTAVLVHEMGHALFAALHPDLIDVESSDAGEAYAQAFSAITGYEVTEVVPVSAEDLERAKGMLAADLEKLRNLAHIANAIDLGINGQQTLAAIEGLYSGQNAVIDGQQFSASLWTGFRSAGVSRDRSLASSRVPARDHATGRQL